MNLYVVISSVVVKISKKNVLSRNEMHFWLKKFFLLRNEIKNRVEKLYS